jgi:lysophospholipid acyltransferase (LPLAT)-like uncharacterized protein
MKSDYHTRDEKQETELTTTAERLAQIAKLVASDESGKPHDAQGLGRNLWTRTVDAVFNFTRRYFYPVHAVGLLLTAVFLFLYARLVALTTSLTTSGTITWPDLPTPCVLALWHRDAPSLLCAFAKHPTRAPAAILVSGDPRGDCMAMLCRMLGMRVVRASEKHNGWEALSSLAEHLKQGTHVVITADGGGPARVAKVGALALASATGVPLMPLTADSHPAIQQSHKWDAARNPVPFARLRVWVGAPQRLEYVVEAESIERARVWLEETLNQHAVNC